MIVPMTKVRILGHKACLDRALATLQELALVQIENAEKETFLHAMALDAERMGHREEARFLLAQLDAMLAILPSTGASAPAPLPEPVDAADATFLKQLRAELDAITPQIQGLARQRDALTHEQMSLPRYQTTLTRLLPLTSELTEFKDYE